ncbi:hypothetical protein [Streptomyces sp. NPDC127038]|uniref:hypothetical protein n=1 Tax=Streptomyces sp. NPDC127038 TaxID=3347114 RepID=UPI00366707A0
MQHEAVYVTARAGAVIGVVHHVGDEFTDRLLQRGSTIRSAVDAGLFCGIARSKAASAVKRAQLARGPARV